MKHYMNTNTFEQTTKPSIALQWHRRGNGVLVHIENDFDFNEKQIYINGASIETSQQKQDKENRAHCRSIAYDLEDYSRGYVYRCPSCGEIITVPIEWTGEKYKCPDCDTVHDGDELEQLSLWDYFEDALDIEYRIGSDKELRSVKIMVTCGGPNIYIDTASKQVELYWWGDKASYPLDYDVCNEIDSFFEEYYNL